MVALWLFQVANLVLPGFATIGQLAPSCRKSAEIHGMNVPFSDDFENQVFGSQPYLMIFGGKGFSWKLTHHKRRKKVGIFQEAWLYNVQTQKWAHPELADKDQPEGRWKTAGAVINGGRELVIFGGCTTTEVSGVKNDMWVFSPSCCPLRAKWRQIKTFSTPPARRGHVMVSTATHLIMAGGKTLGVKDNGAHGGICANDTWTFPLKRLRSGSTEGEWKRVADRPGNCYWGSTGTLLDSGKGGVMSLFGGRYKKANGGYVYSNELWIYDPEHNSWANPTPSGEKPAPRDHHGAANVNGDLYVFGGRVTFTRDASANLNDVWSYAVRENRWRQHTPSDSTTPTARYMPGVTSSMWNGKQALTVFGGESFPGSTKTSVRNDVWVFISDGSGSNIGTWTELSASDCSWAGLEAPTSPLQPLAWWGPGGFVVAVAAGVLVLVVATMLCRIFETMGFLKTVDAREAQAAQPGYRLLG